MTDTPTREHHHTTCDSCWGQKMVLGGCPDFERYARQGATCLVAHYEPCPRCQGTGTMVVKKQRKKRR